MAEVPMIVCRLTYDNKTTMILVATGFEDALIAARQAQIEKITGIVTRKRSRRRTIMTAQDEQAISDGVRERLGELPFPVSLEMLNKPEEMVVIVSEEE